jgi:hypothetical protein
MIGDAHQAIDEIANSALRHILRTHLLVQQSRIEARRGHWLALRTRHRARKPPAMPARTAQATRVIPFRQPSPRR